MYIRYSHIGGRARLVDLRFGAVVLTPGPGERAMDMGRSSEPTGVNSGAR